MNFREYECQRLQNNPKLTFGDVTSVNLTMLQVMEFFSLPNRGQIFIRSFQSPGWRTNERITVRIQSHFRRTSSVKRKFRTIRNYAASVVSRGGRRRSAEIYGEKSGIWSDQAGR